MKTIASCIFLFSLALSVSHAQYDDYSRAEYIYDIIRYIKWENEETTDTFRIAAMGKDSSLYINLAVVGEIRKQVHGKPIKVMLFNLVSDIEKTEVLFVNKHNGYNIDLVLRNIRGSNTLLISENYQYQKSMINFIAIDGKKMFEINEKRLEEAGLLATPLFLALGVKSEADWQELYMQAEVMLDKEKQVVEKQNLRIEKQNQEIDLLQEEIELKRSELEAKRKELELLSGDILLQKKKLEEKNRVLLNQENKIQNQKLEIHKSAATIKGQDSLISKKNGVLSEKEEKINLQNQEIQSKDAKIRHQIAQLNTQRLIIVLAVSLLALMSILGFVIYRSYKLIKRKNRELSKKNIEILEQNEEILQQKEEIETQRDEIIAQRDQIARQNTQIKDSIIYAERIQSAILPPTEDMDSVLDDYFIFNKPRDIVSGDFYWVHEKNNRIVATVADCTGHGVSGAFMSMLGIAFLNDIIGALHEISSNEILDRLREKVMLSLHQTGKQGEAQDGMDISLFVLDKKHLIMQYSGAFNPVFVFRDGELMELKADRMPIGISRKKGLVFNSQKMELQNGDMLYLFSDGYADQFGGDEGKKYNYKRFKSLLAGLSLEPTHIQKQKLDADLEAWMGEKYEQIDDILIMGIRV